MGITPQQVECTLNKAVLKRLWSLSTDTIRGPLLDLAQGDLLMEVFNLKTLFFIYPFNFSITTYRQIQTDNTMGIKRSMKSIG